MPPQPTSMLSMGQILAKLDPIRRQLRVSLRDWHPSSGPSMESLPTMMEPNQFLELPLRELAFSWPLRDLQKLLPPRAVPKIRVMAQRKSKIIFFKKIQNSFLCNSFFQDSQKIVSVHNKRASNRPHLLLGRGQLHSRVIPAGLAALLLGPCHRQSSCFSGQQRAEPPHCWSGG